MHRDQWRSAIQFTECTVIPSTKCPTIIHPACASGHPSSELTVGKFWLQSGQNSIVVQSNSKSDQITDFPSTKCPKHLITVRIVRAGGCPRSEPTVAEFRSQSDQNLTVVRSDLESNRITDFPSTNARNVRPSFESRALVVVLGRSRQWSNSDYNRVKIRLRFDRTRGSIKF